MGFAGLAEVRTGWTGSITIAVGASSITVAPHVRDSVSSLWARVQMRALVELGLTLVLSRPIEGQWVVTGSVAFDLTIDGTCASRCDFTPGAYSGSATYTSDGTQPEGVIVPVYGLRLGDTTIGSTGRSAADGASAAPLVDTGAVARLSLLLTLATCAALEAEIASWSTTRQVHDVWQDGRVLARVRLSGSPVRRPIARTHNATTSPVELALQVTGVAPSDTIQTPAQAVTPKAAYHLWSYVRTDVPGYRELQLGDYLCRVPDGTYRWDAFITAVAAAVALAPVSYTASVLYDVAGVPPGLVYLTGDPGTVLAFPDRLGWLLGFGAEAGVARQGAEEHLGLFIPPGGFPVIGADWAEVEVDRDVQTELDVLRQESGATWGAARLWRVVLTMSRWQLEAYRAGWLRRGRVALVPAGYESTPMTGAEPRGYLDGYVVSDGAVVWLDPPERICELTLTIATPAT